ncbi:hypothetical protein [Burkholderia sp. MBR-1]|uniref:hypothetical protein n=1 Tax=Burkholderia sp. MBR-1 TaxID=2732364 RepID=UPI0015EE5136|nr:hypothetical protein [Burkholderia sp. MBR-1]QMI49780.1 hypothetical protein MBR110_30385 [Burkholderia sp. MBR-1]
MPPKLAVVAHDLDIGTLFSIENRSQTRAFYQRAAVVDSGIFQGNDPIHGTHDQAWYPGRDTATFIGGNARHETAGTVDRLVIEPDGPRNAWLLSQSHLGKVTNVIVVLPSRDQNMADELATSYLRDYFADAPASVKLIGSGTFVLSDSIVAPCGRVRVKQVRTVEASIGHH